MCWIHLVDGPLRVFLNRPGLGSGRTVRPTSELRCRTLRRTTGSVWDCIGHKSKQFPNHAAYPHIIHDCAGEYNIRVQYDYRSGTICMSGDNMKLQPFASHHPSLVGKKAGEKVPQVPGMHIQCVHHQMSASSPNGERHIDLC